MVGFDFNLYFRDVHSYEEKSCALVKIQEPVLQRRCPRELAGNRRSTKRDSQRQLGLGKCLVKERNKIFPFCNILCQLQTVFHYLCATFVCVDMRKIFGSRL